jgi:hypothetical protein
MSQKTGNCRSTFGNFRKVIRQFPISDREFPIGNSRKLRSQSALAEFEFNSFILTSYHNHPRTREHANASPLFMTLFALSHLNLWRLVLHAKNPIVQCFQRICLLHWSMPCLKTWTLMCPTTGQLVCPYDLSCLNI